MSGFGTDLALLFMSLKEPQTNLTYWERRTLRQVENALESVDIETRLNILALLEKKWRPYLPKAKL